MSSASRLPPQKVVAACHVMFGWRNGGWARGLLVVGDWVANPSRDVIYPNDCKFLINIGMGVSLPKACPCDHTIPGPTHRYTDRFGYGRVCFGSAWRPILDGP